ncbi:MAG: exodeoxyribonuclease VII small subunit [Acetobacteraceae bacterium]
MPPAKPAPDAPADIAALSFEDALAELEAIVKRLEGGQARLEQAIAEYERGAALRAHCERKLAEAEAKLQAVVTGANGAPAGLRDVE